MSWPAEWIARDVICGTCEANDGRPCVFIVQIEPCAKWPNGFGHWTCKDCAEKASGAWAKAARAFPLATGVPDVAVIAGGDEKEAKK